MSDSVKSDPLAQVKEALKKAQRTLAMLVDPQIVKITSTIHAWAHAVEAEAAARAALPALDTLGEELARLRYERDRWKGVAENAPSWERLWAEQSEAREAAESRLAKCQDALRVLSIMVDAEKMREVATVTLAALGEAPAPAGDDADTQGNQSETKAAVGVQADAGVKGNQCQNCYGSGTVIRRTAIPCPDCSEPATPPPYREEAPATPTAPDRAADALREFLDDWEKWPYVWSGSDFFSGEGKDEGGQYRQQLYRDLCRLGSHMVWLRDRAALADEG